jgi:anti-sigma B factor antagonist
MTELPEQALHIEEAHGVTLIEVRGEGDLTITQELRARLDELAAAPSARAIVDLTPATFIDSSTLGALAFSSKAFGHAPPRFAVVCPPGELRSMFELTALERVVPLHETRDQALAAVAEAERAG